MEHIYKPFRNLENKMAIIKGLLPHILKYYARLLLFEYLLVIIVLNFQNMSNWNKIGKNSRAKQDKLIKDTLKISEDDEFITFSTITKKGRTEILNKIEEKK